MTWVSVLSLPDGCRVETVLLTSDGIALGEPPHGYRVRRPDDSDSEFATLAEVSTFLRGQYEPGVYDALVDGLVRRAPTADSPSTVMVTDEPRGRPVRMTRREVVLLAEDLAVELGMRLGLTYCEADLVEQAQQAIVDLTGSVAREALPEMAARLATVRLAGGTQRPYAGTDVGYDASAQLNGGYRRPQRPAIVT